MRITYETHTINALVDIACLITFIPSLISGLVLYLVFPECRERGSGWSDPDMTMENEVLITAIFVGIWAARLCYDHGSARC
jgi:hypothetical protein